MKNSIYKRIAWLLVSGILSLLIFVLLGYCGIALKLIHLVLEITGNGHWEGETRSPYIFKAMSGILVVIFLIVLFIANRILFRNRVNNNRR